MAAEVMITDVIEIDCFGQFPASGRYRAGSQIQVIADAVLITLEVGHIHWIKNAPAWSTGEYRLRLAGCRSGNGADLKSGSSRASDSNTFATAFVVGLLVGGKPVYTRHC